MRFACAINHVPPESLGSKFGCKPDAKPMCNACLLASHLMRSHAKPHQRIGLHIEQMEGCLADLHRFIAGQVGGPNGSVLTGLSDP